MGIFAVGSLGRRWYGYEMHRFLDDVTFLLRNKTARALYQTYAVPEPICDYHCHLPPEQIAANHVFPNLYSIWLAGDHYKWRAMRSNGVAERLCTGDASDLEKFKAFAATVPKTLRNPLYHWTHLELKRFFGIDRLLDEHSAEGIWEAANAKLPTMSTHRILEDKRVAVVCTTDDPADPLTHHETIRSSALATRVYPTFRPDKALAVSNPTVLGEWVGKLEATSGGDCTTFLGFCDAIRARHDAFHAFGCRLSDHGLERCFTGECSDAEAAGIYDRARAGSAANPDETERFGAWMMLFFGRLDAARGWTKQLHVGAMRNNNSRLFAAIGPDTGFDSIGDFDQGRALSRYMDRLDATNELPKMVLYNLNPRDNYLFATMVGNFQDGSVAGKIQFGSGWWFLDQKEGMEMQLNALGSLGLLSRFVGMLTDSRSFLSFPRHEYFRRILCNLLGEDMENGELPDDMELVGGLVRDVCFRNAQRHFGLDCGPIGG